MKKTPVLKQLEKRYKELIKKFHNTDDFSLQRHIKGECLGICYAIDLIQKAK